MSERFNADEFQWGTATGMTKLSEMSRDDLEQAACWMIVHLEEMEARSRKGCCRCSGNGGKASD